MKVFVSFLLALVALTSASPVADEQLVVARRDPKLFLVYVTIPVTDCRTNIPSSPTGKCYSAADCRRLGGSASTARCGPKNIGICCYKIPKPTTTKPTTTKPTTAKPTTAKPTTAKPTTAKPTTAKPTTQSPLTNLVKCGKDITVNGGGMTNSMFPNGDNKKKTSCKSTIKLLSADVCQIRLDFATFDIMKTDLAGKCVKDFIEFLNFDSPAPKLCGFNQDQHIYLKVKKGTNPEIKMTYGDDDTKKRRFNIRATQILCSDKENLAPPSCLQYHKEDKGKIIGFNYEKPTEDDAKNTKTNIHLADLDYNICIKTVGTNCKITYKTEAADNKYAFMMTGDGTAVATVGVVGGFPTPAVAAACTDFIEIPTAKYSIAGAASVSRSKYCGLFFPTTVTSTSPSFYVHVMTDGAEPVAKDKSNVGFSLAYEQSSTGC